MGYNVIKKGILQNSIGKALINNNKKGDWIRAFFFDYQRMELIIYLISIEKGTLGDVN